MILDRHYHQIATISAGNGLAADQHEFRLTPDGAPAGYDTYRAYRSPWVGKPTTDPTAVAAKTDPHHISVEAIWNGATEVDRWQVLAGPHPWSLHRAGSAPWDGLNTTIDLRTQGSYVELVALDDNGNTIGRSQAVTVSD